MKQKQAKPENESAEKDEIAEAAGAEENQVSAPIEIIDEGEVVEQDGAIFLKCNRPLSITEYMNLVTKVQMEEDRVGRKIIIIPHATEVVKT